MQKNVLLQDKLHRCQAANKRQKKKKDVPQQFIQDGGSLTVEEALQIIQEKEEAIQVEAQAPRQRRPPTCSNCNVQGHTRTRCPTRWFYIYNYGNRRL